MDQVFISNHVACIQANADTALFSGLSHTTGATDGHDACMVGVYNPSNNRFLDGTTAALSLIQPNNVSKLVAATESWEGDAINVANDPNGTAVAAGQEIINTAPTSPQFLNFDFQIVQAMPSGNPIASPIIQTSQLKRLSWAPNVEPKKHKLAFALDAAYTPSAGDEITLVLNLRWPADIAYYESQINSSGSISGLTPSPSPQFDNPKRIYKASYTVASGDADADVATGLIAAINAHAMGSVVTASDNSTTGIFVEADFFGLVLDGTITKDGTKLVGSTNQQAMVIGTGSFFEAISREKKALALQGIHNRMYLPTGDTTVASTTAGGASTSTATYDRLILEYENRASKMPGFNAGGNTSTITLYTPANASFAAQASGLALADTFGLEIAAADAAATGVEFIW